MIYLFMNNGGIGNHMFQYAIARQIKYKWILYVIQESKSTEKHQQPKENIVLINLI